MKNYRAYRIIIVFLLGATIGVFVSIGNYVVPILAVIAAAALLFVLSRKSKEIMTDERVEKIGGKAANIAYRAITLAAAILGMIFIALGKTNSYLKFAGNTLAYLACASIVIYTISYKYFGR